MLITICQLRLASSVPTHDGLLCRRLGQDPDGHNCYLSAVEAAALTNLDLVFDDDWAVYESYLADLCPAEPGPGPGPPDGTVLRDLCAAAVCGTDAAPCWHSHITVTLP